MTCVPADFLSLAEKLQFALPIDYKSAATVRATAGRMYYAAYLETRESFRALTGNPEYAIDHTPLSFFLRITVKNDWVNEYGEMLEELRQLRTDSDYRLARMVRSHDVGLKFKDAKFIVANQSILRSRLSNVTLPPSQ
jgi:hypothetical protein